MDPGIREAVARIDIMKDGRSIGRGTGFLVADGFVLTALHVVADRFQDPPVPYPGEIALQFPHHAARAVIHEDFFDPKADWALLRCIDPPPIRPMPMGGSPHSGAQWETYGFPDANPRDGMVQVGNVENNHGELDGARVFQLYSKQAAAGNGAPVKGLSGAPIIVHNAAVGLLRFALMKEQNTVAGTLYACPLEAVRQKCGELLPDPLVLVGKRLGSYEIIREIGRGGMGTVYLAKRSDDQFKKRVALKVLREEFDAEDVLRRFRHERQILATLNHPNISTLLDAGSLPSGEPYFVMEYIDGMALDQYCDSRSLPVPDRIRLFRQICGAVQYVHQNLIVHRDLKPSNILVTPDGIPQLLDFGIAKILKADMMMSIADVTRPDARVMTPAYASPEQVRGEPITTASDLYSLGVILYELLTGRRPYRIKSSAPHELTRAICEDDPERPSTAISHPETQPDTATITVEEVSRKRGTQPDKLFKRLQGDLDNILLKAMRKEPQRRYASVEQFSEDLQRHLKNLPVSAHEDSVQYRTAKFFRRHRIATIAAGIAAFSLIGGLAVTLVEANIARRQRTLAERRFQDVRKLATTFLFDVHDSIQNLPGSTPARSLIANTGTEYLDRLARESHGDASLQQEVAEGYLKIGEIEGDPFDANLGDTAKAMENYQKALTLATALVARDPKNIKALRTVADAHSRLSRVLPFRAKAAQGLEHANEAVKIAQELLEKDPGNANTKLLLSGAYESQADILGGLQAVSLGRTAEAITAYEQSLTSLPDVVPGDALAPRVSRGKAILIAKLADAARKADPHKALDEYKDALRIAEDLSHAEPNNRRSRELVSMLLNKAGFAERSVGDIKAAVASYREAVELDEAGFKVDPTNTKARDNIVVTQLNLGELYYSFLNDMPGALQCYRRAVELLEQSIQTDPVNTIYRQRLSVSLTYVGSILLTMGDVDEARKQSQHGLDVAKELADRPNATQSHVYNYAWLGITIDPADLRNPAALLPYALKALQMKGGSSDPYTVHVVAEVYAGTGDYARAVEFEQKALSLLAPLRPGQSKSNQQETFEHYLNEFQAELKKHDRH